MTTRVLIACLILCILPRELFSQGADNQDVVKQVVARWQERRDTIKSVDFKVEGYKIYVKGTIRTKGEVFPSEDLRVPDNREYTIDFSDLRVRSHWEGRIYNTVVGDFHPISETLLYDGKVTKTYSPRETNTSELYTPGARQPDIKIFPGLSIFALMADLSPVLFAGGHVNLAKTQWVREMFEKEIPREQLRFSHYEIVDTFRCAVIKTNPTASGSSSVYWVDLQHGGAVRRWQYLTATHPFCTFDISYQMVSGVWLPSGWRYDQYSDGKPIRSHYYSVIETKLNRVLQSSDFDVQLRQDQVVHLTDDNQYFSVASDTRTLVPYGESTSLTWRFLSWPWFYGSLVLVLICLFFYRRRRMQS